MHRHGYQGRKLGRQRDPRRALIKGLASQLIERGQITTTSAKAKELRPYVEKLVTKARAGDLHSRRLVMARLASRRAAHDLVDKIAPIYKTRPGGYLYIKQAGHRLGDRAPLAKIGFVDWEVHFPPPEEKEEKTEVKS